MERMFPGQTIQRRNPRPGWRFIRAAVVFLSLLLVSEISVANAANLLTNPGFENGLTGWNGAVRGSTVTLVTDPAVAHSGNNCVLTSNAGGWTSVSQGDTQGGWSTGVSLPVSDAKFYKLSAWVKVPSATAQIPQQVTLRYRFEPSGNRVDVGAKLIRNGEWTQLESPWVQPAAGDTYISYWEIHSMANSVNFYADDCSLEESGALELKGHVVDSGGNAVEGATVLAMSPTYAPPAATTAAGDYTFQVPAGTYTIQASTNTLKGSVTAAASANPTTAPNITLAADPDIDSELIFSATSSSVMGSAAWPAAYPAGTMLSPILTPGAETIKGTQWEDNFGAVNNGPGWRVGSRYGGPIPVNGASAVVVVKMAPIRTGSDNWDSVLDVFYDRLVLGVRNDTGLVNVRRKTSGDNFNLAFAPDGTGLVEGQKAVISLVVQPDGTYKVYVNGTQIWENTTPSTNPVAELNPDHSTDTDWGYGDPEWAHYIAVGRNYPDGWTSFMGNIGDVYLYNVAITDAKRTALEQKMMTKFAIDTTMYTMSASVSGVGGTIFPSGSAIKVPGGEDKTFYIASDTMHRIDRVVVDGVDMGPVTSYTFTDVKANGHTIVAYFVSLPAQTVSGKVTDGTDGIRPAYVYFKATPNATVNPDFTLATRNYDGVYTGTILPGTWYTNVVAPGYYSPAEKTVTITNAPVTLDWTLTPTVSKNQPMLVSKGTGAERSNLGGTVGYAFTTGDDPINITALGFVDWEKDGLQSDHSVGIWQGTDLINSVTVPAGTGSTLVGDYRYVNLPSPQLLEPNTTYVIGAEVFPAGDKWPDAAPSPGLSQPDFRFVSGLVFRSHNAQEFVVPEAAGASDTIGATCNMIGQMVPRSLVKGIVKDTFGNGIPNAVVQVGGYSMPAGVTDDNGKYRVYAVPMAAGTEIFADGLGYADKTDTVDTSKADVTPVVKDMTLNGKVETGGIQNGGFEDGLAPWVRNAGTHEVGTTSEVKFSGNFAGYWKATSQGRYNGYLVNDVPIVAGSTYNVYFKLRTNALVGQCGVQWVNANKEEVGWLGYDGGVRAEGDNWMFNAVPNVWEQVINYRSWNNSEKAVGVRLTPPDNAVYLRILIGLAADAVGDTVWVDDVVVDRVGPDVTNPPYTVFDMIDSLRWAAGVSTLPQNYLTRFDVIADGKVDVNDVIRIGRKVSGLEANP